MPEPLYKVFISSPDDLKAERTLCSELLTRANQAWATGTGPFFLEVCWEAGVTVDQAEIDRQLRESDFCVLILHQKWGKGTDREFAVASEERQSRKAAGNFDLAVFCKLMSTAAALEPDAEMVRGLQRRIKNESIYFHDFTDASEFADAFRRVLGNCRDRLRDRRPTLSAIYSPADAELLIKNADAAYEADKWEVAEIHLARALAGAGGNIAPRASVWQRLGNVGSQREAWKVAINHYESALSDYIAVLDRESATRVREFLKQIQSSMQQGLEACQQPE